MVDGGRHTDWGPQDPGTAWETQTEVTCHTKDQKISLSAKDKQPPCQQKDDKDVGLIAAAAKLLQACPALCSPIDGSPPGSPVPGILQTGTLEWVAISFSNA